MRKASSIHVVGIAFLTVFLLLSASVLMRSYAENAKTEAFPLKIYVVDLDGVNSSRVSNASKVLEGVGKLSGEDSIYYWNGSWESLGLTSFRALTEVRIDVKVTLVTDWMAYRLLVEYADNVIILNSHGEIVPVPIGFSNDEWIARIADALLHRNVTWVHIAGYPFYRYWLQEQASVEDWGEQGFKKFMGHIGKSNATCWPLENIDDQSEKIPLSLGVRQDLVGACGFVLERVFYTSGGYPIRGENLEGQYVAPALYGPYDNWHIGEAIRFSIDNKTCDFGFYVHFAGNYTYDSTKVETDRDFCGAYAGSVLAIYANVMKVASIKALRSAEAAIEDARTRGRVGGLENATSLLTEAKEHFLSSEYQYAIRQAVAAEDAAVHASTLQFLELGLVIGGTSVAACILTGGAVVAFRRIRRRKIKES